MSAPAWSFSSLNDFHNCPRAYQLKRVLKEVPNTETEAMRYGTQVHEFLEVRVRDGTTLPDQLSWIEPYLRKMEESGAKMIAEQAVGLTKGLTPTGFFAKDVWCRGKLDLTLRYDNSSTILDYKTGRRKFDSDQLMLFAGFEFASRPEVDTVKTGYVWLKDKAIDSQVFTRSDLPIIWGHFMPKVERVERAYEKNEWPARPSGLCGYCPAKKSQCKHAKN